MKDNSTQTSLYDDPDFLQKYKELRSNPNCANDKIEKPLLFSLLPDLKDKTILDLGCGNGDDCFKFYSMGAKYVLGIDASSALINEAKSKRRTKELERNILFATADINLTHIFFNPATDITYSSLMMHYIKDFEKLCQRVAWGLRKNGLFIFSQEHPNFTAPKQGFSFLKNIDDEVCGAVVKDYLRSGKRNVKWLGKEIIKFHRPLSEIINTLIESGFAIEKIYEPSRFKDNPDFLVVVARKNKSIEFEWIFEAIEKKWQYQSRKEAK